MKTKNSTTKSSEGQKSSAIVFPPDFDTRLVKRIKQLSVTIFLSFLSSFEFCITYFKGCRKLFLAFGSQESDMHGRKFVKGNPAEIFPEKI